MREGKQFAVFPGSSSVRFYICCDSEEMKEKKKEEKQEEEKKSLFIWSLHETPFLFLFVIGEIWEHFISLETLHF